MFIKMVGMEQIHQNRNYGALTSICQSILIKETSEANKQYHKIRSASRCRTITSRPGKFFDFA